MNTETKDGYTRKTNENLSGYSRLPHPSESTPGSIHRSVSQMLRDKSHEQ